MNENFRECPHLPHGTANLAFAAALLLASITGGQAALAAGGTDQIAADGEAVDAVSGWPEGVLDLVKDKVRTNGWHPWFTECPNDMRYFELHVKSGDDLARLVEKLAAIKAPRLVIRLDPGEGAKHAGGAGAIFSIGNQGELLRWYLALPQPRPGVRRFGLHEFTVLYPALPPTLTLYAGHEAVDLKALDVPASIEVAASITDAQRLAKGNEDVIKAIDDFVAGHKIARQGMTRPPPE